MPKIYYVEIKVWLDFSCYWYLKTEYFADKKSMLEFKKRFNSMGYNRQQIIRSGIAEWLKNGQLSAPII